MVVHNGWTDVSSVSRLLWVWVYNFMPFYLIRLKKFKGHFYISSMLFNFHWIAKNLNLKNFKFVLKCLHIRLRLDLIIFGKILIFFNFFFFRALALQHLFSMYKLWCSPTRRSTKTTFNKYTTKKNCCCFQMDPWISNRSCHKFTWTL